MPILPGEITNALLMPRIENCREARLHITPLSISLNNVEQTICSGWHHRAACQVYKYRLRRRVWCHLLMVLTADCTDKLTSLAKSRYSVIKRQRQGKNTFRLAPRHVKVTKSTLTELKLPPTGRLGRLLAPQSLFRRCPCYCTRQKN